MNGIALAVALAFVLAAQSPALAEDEDPGITVESVDDIYPHLPKKGRKNWDSGRLVEAIELSKYPFLPRHVYELVDKEVEKDVITAVAAKAAVFYNGENLKPLHVQAAEARVGAPPQTIELTEANFLDMLGFFDDIRKQIEDAEEQFGKLEPQRPGEKDDAFDKRKRAYDEALVKLRGPFDGKIEATTWVITLPAVKKEVEGCMRPVAMANLEPAHFYAFRAAAGTRLATAEADIAGNVDKVWFTAKGTPRRFEALGRCDTGGSSVRLTMKRTFDGAWSGTGGLLTTAMALAEVARTVEAVRTTRGRNAKADHIAALLSGGDGDVRDILVCWLAGELRQGRIGVGYQALRTALQTAAAAEPSLTVAGVDAALTAISAIGGTGSTARRREALAALFGAATELERSLLTGLLSGELRQGAQAGVRVEGIARAAGVPAATLRRALMLSGDARIVAATAFAEGADGLARFRLEVFRAVGPMLAQPAADLTEALASCADPVLEWKLDGARIQAHRSGDTVRVFTRLLHDVTAAVPEAVEVVRALPCDEVVLDGEVLALRPDGAPHPFQTTMRRFGRTLNVEELRAQLPLTPFFFDVLRADGTELIDAPLRERLDRLDALVPPEHRVRTLRSSDPDEGRTFLQQTLDLGHEGIMVKDLAAPYAAGRRGAAWLKVKPHWTLDLVVLAVDWGSGRRKGWLSNLHLGARNEDGSFTMLGKTFKGMTDELLAWQTQALLALESSRGPYTVHVRPELVVEIAFQDVQQSPRYPAGLALRFARVKGYRPDKSAAEADTLETVRAIHEGRMPRRA